MTNLNTNISKTQRQLIVVEKWRVNKGRGTLIAATGFGKTYTAILVIKALREKTPTSKVEIVVPTINLYQQWMKELIAHNLIKNTWVTVINTAYKDHVKCDLLVLDEIHCYGAPEFSKIFDVCEYKYILGLTATIERSDGKHEILKKYSPIIDIINLEECSENNWVSKYNIYNLAVDFTEEERIAYNKKDKTFRYAASKIGFGGAAFTEASRLLKDPDADPQMRAYAAMYYNAMRERAILCKNAVNKILLIKDIIDMHPDRKALVFSDNTKFADDLQDVLGNICVTFHSKMTPKEQRQALKMFEDNRTKKRVISSVKALNQGFNIPDCSLGIIAAGNSRKLDNVQRTGRLIRWQKGKTAIIINLYVPDTQEVNWLRKRQEDVNPVFINNINEII